MIGITILMSAIILIFNLGLREIVASTCTHGSECVMYDTITTQTLIGFLFVAIVLGIGLFIMFSRPEEKIIIKKTKQRKKKLNLKDLDKDEKKVVNLLLNEGKAMFQSDLMEKMNIGKVKTKRLLDKLESKQILERKRRGMNNIVVLKE